MTKPLKLPSDLPLDEKGREQFDDYRLEPIINTLYDVLDNWLRITLVKQHGTAPRLGVYGGFGQGKSTVIENVCSRLIKNQSWIEKCRDFFWGSRIARFDVSFFKSDDLEWRFFKSVLLWRILRNLCKAALIFLVLICIYFASIYMTQTDCFSDLSNCWRGLEIFAEMIVDESWHWIGQQWRAIATFVIFVPLINFFLRAHPVNQAGSHLSYRDLFIQTLTKWIPALPDIVIIDDLDRASVEQQRSFLRAISRFSRELNFAVVVCMDESNILASPANPEEPEELLRKIITLELRIPDRGREDIVLLAAVCVREFAKLNQKDNTELCYQLTSVQFVSDLCRVLLLEHKNAPISPRKVLRLLSNVISRANQLGLQDSNDLSALLRIDGLCRLVPSLRHHLNHLCKALESNRLSAFESLLAKPEIRTTQELAACDFFQATRMMQPALKDGWFKLAAHNNYYGTEDVTNLVTILPWKAEWKVGKRSFVFFRLFMDAIELDMAGYPQDLMLNAITDGYKFTVAAGYYEDFVSGDLPENFAYFSQCWLLWIAVFNTATVPQRDYLYHRALTWLDTAPEDIKPALLDLFWRECLADVLMWDSFSSYQRAKWWQLARDDAKKKDQQGNVCIKQERFYAISLEDKDYAHVWSILGGSGQRDSRKALEWQRPITPIVKAILVEATDKSSFAAAIWPSPSIANLDSVSLNELFKQHFIALNTISKCQLDARYDSEIPTPLTHAWRLSQATLTLSHCLELIDMFCFETTENVGLRWSLQSPKPWIMYLGKDRLTELEELITKPDTTTLLVTPSIKQKRALLIIAITQKWHPNNPPNLLRHIPKDQIKELRDTLRNSGNKYYWFGM